MHTKTKSSPGFTLTLNKGREYQMLYIRIMADYTSTYRSISADIQYQANIDQPLDFYGGYLESKVESLADLGVLHKFISGIFKPAKSADGIERTFSFNRNASEVITRLSNSMPQVAYDQRFTNYVPIDQIMPEDMVAYRDDYRAYGQTSCMVGCVARNEDEARRLLTIEYCEQGSHYTEKMNAWLAAGRPVMQLDRTAPSFTKACDVLASIAEAAKQIAA